MHNFKRSCSPLLVPDIGMYGSAHFIKSDVLGREVKIYQATVGTTHNFLFSKDASLRGKKVKQAASVVASILEKVPT